MDYKEVQGVPDATRHGRNRLREPVFSEIGAILRSEA
jgi:hypothetical protein